LKIAADDKPGHDAERATITPPAGDAASVAITRNLGDIGDLDLGENRAADESWLA